MNTITLDNVTLIYSLVLIIMSIVTPMFNPFFRFRKQKDTSENSSEPDQNNLPPLSIVLTPFDDTDSLRRNLPLLLDQDYAPGYQVIVVIEQGDHDAEGIISLIQHERQAAGTANNAHIYVTYIPGSSRYISRKKLAVTLGVKAAKTEWIVLTETTCRPASRNWLATMARHCPAGKRMVVGYSRYADDTSAYRQFEHIHTAAYLIHETVCGKAYGTNSCNLLFRKGDFMEQGGYLGNLNLMRGEYDFLVNKYTDSETTIAETSESAWLIEDSPSSKAWLNKHLFYLESRKYLERGFRHRFWFNLDQTMLHLTWLLILAAIVYAGITANWILLGAAICSLLTATAFRALLTRRATACLGADIPALTSVFHQTAVMWHNMRYILRYRMADKSDFTTHKL